MDSNGKLDVVWLRSAVSFFGRKSVVAGYRATTDCPAQVSVTRALAFTVASAFSDTLYMLGQQQLDGDSEFLLNRMQWATEHFLSREPGALSHLSLMPGDIPYAVGDGEPTYVLWYTCGLTNGSTACTTSFDSGLALTDTHAHAFFHSRGPMALLQCIAETYANEPQFIRSLASALQSILVSVRSTPGLVLSPEAVISAPIRALTEQGLLG